MDHWGGAPLHQGLGSPSALEDERLALDHRQDVVEPTFFAPDDQDNGPDAADEMQGLYQDVLPVEHGK